MKEFIIKNSLLVKLGKGFIAFAFWICVWYLAAYKMGQELLIPAPVSVFKTMLELMKTEEFWLAAGTSLLRVFAGFLAGVVAGIVLATLTNISSICDCLFSPVIRVVRATPVASFIILALLWISYSYLPVFIAALMVTPVIWGNVSAGIQATDKKYLELAQIYHFSNWKKVRIIYVPSVMSYFYSGSITSLGMAWKAGIAAEILCLPKTAIGTQLYYSKIYLETPSLFAWTVLVIILSFLLEKGFVLLFTRSREKLKREGVLR